MQVAHYLRAGLNNIHNKLGKPVLAKTLRFTPFQVKKNLLQPLLNSAFQTAIEDGDLAFLAGKVAVLHITDLDESFYLTVNNTIQLLSPPPRSQLRISGELDSFVRLALRREDPDTLFFQRKITIEGDTELGLAVKNLIDAVDMDELPTAIRKGLACSESLYNFLQSKRAAS